jgi:ABC-type dipeptide/oligopeptide/nickel transport system permease subunit
MSVAQSAIECSESSDQIRTPLRDAIQQLRRNKAAMISAAFILLLVLTAVFAKVLAPYDPAGTHLRDAYALPGGKYLLGADSLGRCILSRIIYGARVSITVALVAATVSMFIGLVYGLVSGYAGGRVDNLMMRIVDYLYGLPTLIVVILFQAYFKAVALRGQATGFVKAVVNLNSAMGGLLFVFVVIGALNWIGMARLARGQVLSCREKEFVVAARAIGANGPRIIFKHLLPNILGPCVVQETLQIPGYILTEAFLSFIGLGVDPPTPSWGIMIQEGYQALRSYPHVIFAPAGALALTVLAFNFLGDGLRDAFDPSMRGM